MQEFILGLGDVVNDGANVAGLAQGLSHDLGVIDLVIDQQNLGVEIGVGCTFRHGVRIVGFLSPHMGVGR